MFVICTKAVKKKKMPKIMSFLQLAALVECFKGLAGIKERFVT